MQSLFQYLRLLRGVQDVILRTQQPKRPAGSSTGASTIQLETAPQTDVEERSNFSHIPEKSTPFVDYTLLPGAEVLHLDESEDSIVFVVD